MSRGFPVTCQAEKTRPVLGVPNSIGCIARSSSALDGHQLDKLSLVGWPGVANDHFPLSRLDIRINTSSKIRKQEFLDTSVQQKWSAAVFGI